MALTKVPAELSSTPGIVDNSNATAITIDSSENVLVGTTDTAVGVGNTNTGLSLRNDGFAAISRTGSSSQPTLVVNKNTNDGELVGFFKAGSVVGNISTIGGDFVIGSTSGSDAALRMDGTNNQIYPSNATGSARDNAISLGASSVRFKDIYLSGGVNFSANANASGMTSELLDDYEEGAWTPAFTGTITAGPTVSGSSTASGTYVKVGSQVTCYFSIDFNDNSTNFGVDQRFSMEGLPFNPAQATIASAGTWWAYASINSGNNAFGQVGTQNDDTFYFYVTHLDGGVSYGAPLIGSITFSV